MKKFMYLDETVKIGEHLPKRLIDDMKELDRFYEDDMWLEFSQLLEGVEVTTKAYQINKVITAQDLDVIFRRYGLR